MKWQPAKPRLPIKVVECGPGKWDEQDHGLDYPGELHTIDFRVTGRGHRDIERLFQAGCAERGRKFTPYDDKAPEQRVGMWICCNASSFVLFDTKPRATVIGFVHEEDAARFGATLFPLPWPLMEVVMTDNRSSLPDDDDEERPEKQPKKGQPGPAKNVGDDTPNPLPEDARYQGGGGGGGDAGRTS